MNSSNHEQRRTDRQQVRRATIGKAIADYVGATSKFAREQRSVNRIACNSKTIINLASTINDLKAGKSIKEFSRMYESEPVVLDAEKIHDADK